MRFDHIHINEYDSRSEYYCDIYDDNNIRIGFCKYYKKDWYFDDVYIEYIYINENDRRRGYATQMVRELQRLYCLKWDDRFTEQGRGWYDSLIRRSIV